MKRIHYLIAFLSLWSCARQTTPNGGPQDKKPPVLLHSTPDNNEKNFKGKTVTLTFNEAVKLKDPKEEIIIAPSAGKDILFTAKQNRIIVEFKKGLSDSTTYSIAFREGIQDITESNPSRNLRLAFSTGPIIDSLRLTGHVADGLTEKTPQDITVAIYSSDTFNIYKHTPDYFTKTNKSGRFIISNLKAGSYRLYAFEDKNKNLKLETKSEKFGFIPGKIELLQNIDSIPIIMVNLDARALHMNNIRHTEKLSRAKFNKPLVHYSVTFSGKKFLNTFGDDQTEIEFFYPESFTDSLAATIHGIDSLDQTIDTLVYLKTGKGGTVKETFKTELRELLINTETGVFTTSISVNKPLRQISLDSTFLRLDSLTIIPIEPSDVHYDTAFNRIDIVKTLDRKLIDTTHTPIDFQVGKKSLITIENDSSKVMTKKITIPKPEDTATLLLDIQTREPEFVVQLLTADYKIIRSVRNTKKITFKNVPPTDYKVRVVIDANKNNQWDPGNINKDIPPERTFFYRNSDGKYQFPIRANWEVGPYVISF
jgi:uncharacterized protein (DUF2141 family)